MGRGIHTTTLAQLESTTARPVLFVEIQLDGGTERFHTALGEFVWGGQTWYGVGQMASFDEMAETTDLKADPVRMSLNGFDADVTNMIDTEDVYLAPVLIYLGALGDSLALVADPDLIYSGFAQDIELLMGGAAGDAALLSVESELINLARPRAVRYTEAQLQSEFAGDLGLQYLEQTVDARTVWRGRNAEIGGGGGAPRGPRSNPDGPRRGGG